MSIITESLLNVVIQLIIFMTPVIIVYGLRRKKLNTTIFLWLGLKKAPVTKTLMLSAFKTLLACLIIMLVPICMMMHFKLMDSNLFATAGDVSAGLTMSNIISVLVKAWIQTALIEEIFFRGFIGKLLVQKTNYRLGNVLQGLIFGLPHGLPFMLMTGNHVAGIILILSAAFVGMLQLNLNETQGKGSIWPSVVIHGIMNTLSFGARLL